jgi:hypothetical protein
MSSIVAFRDRICEAIRKDVPELQDVDWYDGLFDEHDIGDWVLKTPCARVAVMNVPTSHHSTMELNADLRCVVAIIDQDSGAQRDADERAWSIVEKIAILANLNTFGDPNAAAATGVKFQRISQPVLRREGVTVGIVEWHSGLTIGRNRVLERDYVWYNGKMVTQTPSSKLTASSEVHTKVPISRHEIVDLTPEEE